MNKILVTGGAGYIGSHTIKALRKAGFHDIVVVDDLSTGYKRNVPEDVSFIQGDFSEPDVLSKLKKENIHSVIHFAASKIAPESVTNPGKYYENNVAKSILLLNWCVENKVENFIFSSSAAVYGDVQDFPITEDFETKPTNPYGWSKLMFEQILSDASDAYGLKTISLRYFNAGGADPEGELGNNHEKGEDVISALIRTADHRGTFEIFGTDYDTKDGACVRDIVHVSDLADAHVMAITYLVNGGESGVFNLGSEKGFTVLDMVDVTKKITQAEFVVKKGPRREGDIVVSIASSGKAKRILGWKPNYSLNDIIKTAWNWQLKIPDDFKEKGDR